MTLAKVSSAFLIERVAPQTRKAKTILYAMCAVWAIYAAFAIAFECGTPSWTERSFECGNGGLSVSVIVLNMITDLVLAGWLVPTLWSLSLDKEKCMTATILFGARVVYVLRSIESDVGADFSGFLSLPEHRLGPQSKQPRAVTLLVCWLT